MNSFFGKIAIIGTGSGESSYLSVLCEEPYIDIIGMTNPNPVEFIEAEQLKIPVTELKDLLDKKPDIIINLSDDEGILSEILINKPPKTEIIGAKAAQILIELLEKRQQRDREVRILLNETKELYKIGVALTSSRGLEEVLNTLLIETLRILNAPAGSIALYDEKSNSLMLRACHGFSDSFSNIKQWFRRSGGMTEHILSKRIPTVVSDTEKYPFVDNKNLIGEGIRSLIAVPLFASEQIIGILYIDDFRPREWTDREIEFITLLGIQAAYAIEKFNLIATIAEKNKELQELNERLEDRVIEKTGELAKANKELEKANRLKSQFIATMSHELRTPINSILGFSELLMDETFGALTEKQKRYANNIYNSGNHLLQLINNILDIAKIESGKMELNYESFSVQQVIEEVVGVIKSLANKKRQRLDVKIDEKVSLIKADRVKFKQVLYNLLSNAVKFTPEAGDITVEAEIIGTTASLNTGEPLQYNLSIPFQHLRLSVTDTGIGIKKEDQELIFSEFVQVDSSFSRKYEGTGLGLALTKRFVEMHGGSIFVESEEGKGSKFTVVIPLFDFAFIEREMKEILRKQEIPSYEEFLKCRRGESPLILVIEDDPSATEMLTLYLAQGGYRVAHANDGYSAIEKAREIKPFAILLDVMLPGKDGWEILQELKLDPELKDIPVVISSIIDNRDLGFALGASDYLVKPFDRTTILKKLDDLCFSIKQGKRMVNVLCIDDNPDVLELLSSILESDGYNVITASSGRHGIESALAFRPDLIILDLMMPEIDGFEVVKTLKSNPYTQHIPILVFTSKDLTMEDRLRLAGKIENFMQKSHFSREDLLMIIKDLEATYPERAGLLDEVSGLFDHSYFQIRLAQEVSRAGRHKNVLSLLMLDLDNFTEYIKAHGIHRSNLVIKKIAEFLRKSLRGSDIAVRYGIDEFAVILNNTLKESSEIVAERILSYIKGYPFYGQEIMPHGKITASIAIVGYPHDATSAEELVYNARQVMRRVKKEGGNKVELYAR